MFNLGLELQKQDSTEKSNFFLVEAEIISLLIRISMYDIFIKYFDWDF